MISYFSKINSKSTIINYLTMNQIKINILSPGRFHVCDLARELDKNEFDVKFYSFVPTKRALKFGLPKHCSASLFYLMIPFLILEKKLFKKQKWPKVLTMKIQDYLTAITMRRCDILIAMSGYFVYAVEKAKKRGSIIILERGSKHILEQKKILESIPSLKGKKPVPDINVKRELQGYELADYIAVASQHVVESFLIHNYPQERLFKNPYGVDLTMFSPQPRTEKKYDFIMVGGWSYQKGCDIIIEAIRKTSYSFLHVGSISDLNFPKETRFTHVDAVDQSKLIDYYNQAKIFILPSRQEGLAMVQAQAIACNLPLIGSKNSGAEDLQQMVEYPQFISLIENYTPESLIKAMNQAMENYSSLKGKTYAGTAIENLTWEAYGKRYANFLHSIIKK